MKRFLLPLLVVVPFAASLAAPAKPKVVVPPKVVPAPAKSKVVTPPKAAVPAQPKDPLGDSVDFLWQQSDEAFHKGDYPTAIKLHRAIVTLDPTDTESFGVGAWLLWSLGQKADARAFIQQGLTANPQNAEMWNVAAEHYDLEKSFSDAKSAYLKSVELSGAKADEMLRRRLAHSAEHAGDLELSVQTWQDLARDFPNSPVDKNNLARVKGLKGKA